MITFNSLNIAERPPKAGDVILINRKRDDRSVKILCKVREVHNDSGSIELILSNQNDYFSWDMYQSGDSWVWRVWNLGQISLNSTTNSLNRFPR